MEFSEETSEHQKALVQLHGILERQHRHFGYRVANEIARFVNLAREQAAEADRDAAVDAAFDLALLQKVLPKFHGTQQELESLLEEIFQFAVHGGGQSHKKNQTVELDDWKWSEWPSGDQLQDPVTLRRHRRRRRSGFQQPGSCRHRYRTPGLPANRREGLANAPPTSGPRFHVVHRVTGP